MIHWRPACLGDLPAVMALLAEDASGPARDKASLAALTASFRAMQAEGQNQLIVGEDKGAVIACYQICVITGISLSAPRRAQIEAVRTASALRGQGIGTALMQDAESRARRAGCSLMQLNSHATRLDAHRFYARLGYRPSHTGFKKPL